MHKIGIIGGGQLGKMMILDAKRLDDYFVILDPTLHCPAHSIADEHIVADFDDVAAIEELASKVDVVTYEFEHISVKALQQVEAKECPVYPSSETLLHIQNKYDQKQWLMSHGLPVHAEFFTERCKALFFFLFHCLGQIIHAVMNHIGIFQYLIHRPVFHQFIIVMINGRTDDLRLLAAGETKICQNLSGQFCSLMCVIVIGTCFIRMHIMEHGCHGSKFRILSPFLRNHCGCQRYPI